ncbi:MAG: helix-turn-helix transcriptional regulator [Fermentimonas sp.]|nr:helix-turn-helix transcriptional regulator [Fermentimonas sp.]
MGTNYLLLHFVEDIGVFFIFTQPIIVASVVIAIILFLSLRKKMDTIIAILKRSNVEQPYVTKNVKEQNNIPINFDDEIKELNNSINLSNHQKEILLFNRFEGWLEEYKYFLKPNFDLNWAAREIGTNRSYLSKSINSQGFGFSEYINKLRIKEVIKIFEDENDIRNNYSLPEIASMVGFNTVSVFYNSFHKETGMTPSQYKDNLKQGKFHSVDEI